MMATGSGWRYFGAALLVAAIVVPATLYFLTPAPTDETPATSTPVKHVSSAFGPGLLPTAKAESAPQNGATAIDPWVPSGMEVTSDNHLVINKEMRSVFDYFLQPTIPGDRSERMKKLQAYLKNTLPPIAYEESTPIVLSYAKYLDALDARNATDKGQEQNASLPTSYSEIEQMKTKMAEIDRLRQTILGIRLADLWFANEEAGMRQFLERRGQPPRIVIPDSNG